jgi:hypothetical protein
MPHHAEFPLQVNHDPNQLFNLHRLLSEFLFELLVLSNHILRLDVKLLHEVPVNLHHHLKCFFNCFPFHLLDHRFSQPKDFKLVMLLIKYKHVHVLLGVQL